jgi:3-dehydro-L-gulonate 2-dehydrogenase
MKNTNHWMRGGAYGWQAADNGMLGMCWTNTWPNMPAWGGLEQKLGNNPFIMAVPKQNGHHMVLDMAVSQYAYGKVEFSHMKGEQLPYPGGWDTKGNLTTDPGEIMKSKRFLPVGYWKGSGMSILMDVFGNALAAGYLVNEVKSKFGGEEMGLTQLFMAINPRVMDTPEYTDSVIDRVVEDIKASTPETEGVKIFYPGEIEVMTREDHMKNGIPVLDEVWDKIQALKK